MTTTGMLDGGTNLPDASDTRPETATHIVLAQHGILTSRAHVTWPERFAAFSAHNRTGLHVVTDQYDSGPFPRLNMFWKNRRLGKAQAAILEHWARTGPKRSRISLVGHSNGCDVIRHTALALAKREIYIDSVILIAAPLNPRIPWLSPLVESGTIQRLSVWASPNDHVLHGSLIGQLIRWPYGNLGRVGLATTRARVSEQQPAHGMSLYTRWFNHRHTEYFAQPNEAATFRTIIDEIRA